MSISVRLAVRDWDYLTPLVLGDVASDRIDLKIDRVGTLISNVGTDPAYDGAETSFSRYASQRAAGTAKCAVSASWSSQCSTNTTTVGSSTF